MWERALRRRRSSNGIVAVGEAVKEDQVLAAVMTDKATVEIPRQGPAWSLSSAGELGARLAVGSTLVGIRFGADDDGVANGRRRVCGSRIASGPKRSRSILDVTSPNAGDGRNDRRGWP